MPGKRVQIDEETWGALRLLASDRMATFQELAEEAFGDLLIKHGRATDLRTQLKKSAAPQKTARAARGGKSEKINGPKD
ncbi:MAG: hypothetical protein Q8M31_16310 [Beijerinckiaceae bacterium]|nr:hypothetical protein [Beijerinckiaceae bacterium]